MIEDGKYLIKPLYEKRNLSINNIMNVFKNDGNLSYNLERIGEKY
jgi:hypothetical protein